MASFRPALSKKFRLIDSLCREYESTEESDVPVPQEIVACFAKLISASQGLRQMIERVILMLQRTDLAQAKSIENALATLKAHLAA